MNKEVLFILTNVDKMKDGTEKPTGTTIFSLAEAYQVFTKHGFSVAFASPNGGPCPIDQHSIDHHGKEESCAQFLSNQTVMNQMKNSCAISGITSNDLARYKMIFIPGGIGQLWDIAHSQDVTNLIAHLYEHHGVTIGTVGHGLCALLNAKLSNGKYILEGKTVTGFTNEEEQDSSTLNNVPLTLEEEVEKRGGKFVHQGKWKTCIQKCDGIITAQNQRSSAEVAEQMCLKAGSA